MGQLAVAWYCVQHVDMVLSPFHRAGRFSYGELADQRKGTGRQHDGVAHDAAAGHLRRGQICPLDFGAAVFEHHEQTPTV